MKGAQIGLLFALALLLSVTYAAVYEARNSDDVDFFLAHNPEENGALIQIRRKTQRLSRLWIKF